MTLLRRELTFGESGHLPFAGRVKMPAFPPGRPKACVQPSVTPADRRT
jgi:hypothetical protein